jgi:hypothetical protein
MGIDRIGKGSAPPPSGPTSSKGAGSSERVRGPEPSRPFEVRTGTERAGEAAKASEIAGAGPSPLERLRSGQIDLNGYLDLKVDQATAHLHGLSPVELSAVKTMLRDQIAQDPSLTDLVKQATGRAPAPPED